METLRLRDSTSNLLILAVLIQRAGGEIVIEPYEHITFHPDDVVMSDRTETGGVRLRFIRKENT